MPLYRGATEIPQALGELVLGTTNVTEVYQGTTMVWTATTAGVTIDSVTPGETNISVAYTTSGTFDDIRISWGTDTTYSTGNMVTTANPYDITGLSSGTAYFIRVEVRSGTTVLAMATASVSTTSAFTLADLGLAVTGTQIPEAGLTSGASLLPYFAPTAHAASVSSLTIVGNTGTVTVDTDIAVDYSVQGTVPAGFTNAGTAYSFTGTTVISLDAIDATAQWDRSTIGTVTGGTLTDVGSPTISNWSGAGVSNIQPSAAASTPTSATCDPSLQFCDISRTTTQPRQYTGATRTDTYTCSINVAGEGSPTCAAVSSLGLPTGNVGDTGMYTQTGLTRSAPDSVTSEDRSVTNDAYAPLGQFTAASLQVGASGTQLPQGGITAGTDLSPYVSIGLNAGSVTSITGSAVGANTSTNTVNRTVTWSASGTIPANYIDAGAGYNVSGSVTLSQAGLPTAPATSISLNPTEADITDGTTATGTVNVTANAGGTWSASTAATALVSITGSTGTGSGSFTWTYNGGSLTRPTITITVTGATGVSATFTLSQTT